MRLTWDEVYTALRDHPGARCVLHAVALQRDCPLLDQLPGYSTWYLRGVMDGWDEEGVGYPVIFYRPGELKQEDEEDYFNGRADGFYFSKRWRQLLIEEFKNEQPEEEPHARVA